jgi:hypothetical protein
MFSCLIFIARNRRRPRTIESAAAMLGLEPGIQDAPSMVV